MVAGERPDSFGGAVRRGLVAMAGGVAAGSGGAKDLRASGVPIHASVRRRVRVLVAALVVGCLSALVSAAVMVTAAWLLLSERSASTRGLVVLVGTVVGAGAGGWFSQPVVARLLAPLGGDRRDG